MGVGSPGSVRTRRAGALATRQGGVPLLSSLLRWRVHPGWMAEQNFTQAIRIADRGYVIVHGQIAFAGNSAAELNDNALIRKFYLGA